MVLSKKNMMQERVHDKYKKNSFYKDKGVNFPRFKNTVLPITSS